jgi:hypothetical protein
MLSREGAFLDRERFWEDEPRSVIPGGVGLFHVMGKIILLMRFAEKVLKVWNVNPQAGLRLSVRLNNVKGRYLREENQSGFPRRGGYISEPEVQAAVDIPVDDLWPARHEIAVNLVEDVAWQCGRDDMTRQFLEGTLRRVRDHLGSEYSLD